jgi:hypothetical protein
MSPFQGFDSNLNPSHRLRGGLNNFALRALGPLGAPDTGSTRYVADGRPGCEKRTQAEGNSSLSSFALCFPIKVRYDATLPYGSKSKKRQLPEARLGWDGVRGERWDKPTPNWDQVGCMGRGRGA